MEGRADISGGYDILEGGLYFWRVGYFWTGCLCLWRGGQKFVEGRADISGG